MGLRLTPDNSRQFSGAKKIRAIWSAVRAVSIVNVCDSAFACHTATLRMGNTKVPLVFDIFRAELHNYVEIALLFSRIKQYLDSLWTDCHN